MREGGSCRRRASTNSLARLQALRSPPTPTPRLVPFSWLLCLGGTGSETAGITRPPGSARGGEHRLAPPAAAPTPAEGGRGAAGSAGRPPAAALEPRAPAERRRDPSAPRAQLHSRGLLASQKHRPPSRALALVFRTEHGMEGAQSG